MAYRKKELILKHVTTHNSEQWINHRRIIDATAKISMHIYGGPAHNTIRLLDLSNAQCRGEMCQQFTITLSYTDPEYKTYCIQNLIHDVGTLKTLFRYCQRLPWEPGQYGGWKEIALTFSGHRYKVYRGEEKAIRVFSPLDLGRIKPLKKAPKKWTVAHAVRAIVNGQFSKLHSNYVQVCDSGQGDTGHHDIEDHLGFIRPIIESPSGWWVSGKPQDGSAVNLCCHTFDSNYFVFDLTARRMKGYRLAS